mmetsp:Transcript_783/g.3040  ORF Transcript_783/g.3040 Transcript_783/m.3040 type:complete len:255 (+) Transcript_783:1592-2356(+)
MLGGHLAKYVAQQAPLGQRLEADDLCARPTALGCHAPLCRIEHRTRDVERQPHRALALRLAQPDEVRQKGGGIVREQQSGDRAKRTQVPQDEFEAAGEQVPDCAFLPLDELIDWCEQPVLNGQARNVKLGRRRELLQAVLHRLNNATLHRKHGGGEWLLKFDYLRRPCVEHARDVDLEARPQHEARCAEQSRDLLDARRVLERARRRAQPADVCAGIALAYEPDGECLGRHVLKPVRIHHDDSAHLRRLEPASE